MPRRIDVELTSARPDGTWTWRAAGAREPKGAVDGALVPGGAKAGDVLRAEVEVDVDGLLVVALLPAKEKGSRPDRLELAPRPEQPGVTSSLVPGRARPERRERSPRPGVPGDRAGRDSAPPGRTPGRPDAPGQAERPARPPRERPSKAAERPDRPDQRGAERRRPDRGRPPETAPPERPRVKRLTPGNRHREAVLESLPPEQQPIADQVLRGGIPAVRRAVEEQNAKNRAEGQPEIRADPLVAIAEEMLPRLKAAEWRDRAEAAATDVDEISLRDLRSVVVGADVAARDEETRLLASTLREALERRSKEQREAWVAEVAAALEEGRLVRALRVSSRPPDPSVRFPAELALKLGEAASAAMAPDTPPERWSALLDAVVASPVRRSVKPVGLPAQRDDGLLQAAVQAAGRVPALAALLGIDMPPPPGPPRPPKGAQRPSRPPGPPRRAPGRRDQPPPPPPPNPSRPAPVTNPAVPQGGDTAPTDGDTAETSAGGPARS